jgi:DNA-binding transcriptional MerR regulator
MDKSLEAFRTISEVADELDVPKHVLRFWEVKFPQIKPMKRGGGRRFYRPEDVVLLRGIRTLLHAEGYTIKGVQKILREHGVDGVKSYASASTKKAGRTAAGRAEPRAEPAGASDSGRIRKLPKVDRSAADRSPADRASANAADGKQSETPDHDRLIDRAIRELQACRSALASAGGATSATDAATASKAARAR